MFFVGLVEMFVDATFDFGEKTFAVGIVKIN